MGEINVNICNVINELECFLQNRYYTKYIFVIIHKRFMTFVLILNISIDTKYIITNDI